MHLIVNGILTKSCIYFNTRALVNEKKPFRADSDQTCEIISLLFIFEIHSQSEIIRRNPPGCRVIFI